MDEWPALKKKLPWSDATFAALKELDTRDLPSIDGVAADDGEDEGGKPSRAPQARLPAGRRRQGRPARGRRFPPGRVRGLQGALQPDRMDYLKAVPPARGAKALASGLGSSGKALARTAGLVRMALSSRASRRRCCWRAGWRRSSVRRGRSFRHPAARWRGCISRASWSGWRARSSCTGPSRASIPGALRRPGGRAAGEGEDLRYPWRDPYYYRRTPSGVRLAAAAVIRSGSAGPGGRRGTIGRTFRTAGAAGQRWCKDARRRAEREPQAHRAEVRGPYRTAGQRLPHLR